MVGAIDAVCDVAQRIIPASSRKAVPAEDLRCSATCTQLRRRSSSTNAGDEAALCRQRRPAEGHQASSRLHEDQDPSAARFWTDTRAPSNPAVPRLESLAPNRKARRSCCWLTRLRGKKASSFLTRPRRVRLQYPHGLPRTWGPSAVKAVAGAPTSRQKSTHSNSPASQRRSINARLTPTPPVTPALGRIRDPAAPRTTFQLILLPPLIEFRSW